MQVQVQLEAAVLRVVQKVVRQRHVVHVLLKQLSKGSEALRDVDSTLKGAQVNNNCFCHVPPGVGEPFKSTSPPSPCETKFFKDKMLRREKGYGAGTAAQSVGTWPSRSM